MLQLECERILVNTMQQRNLVYFMQHLDGIKLHAEGSISELKYFTGHVVGCQGCAVID